MPFKQDLRNFMNYLIHQAEKAGVDIRLNTEATPESVAAMKPDAILSAVGADPFILPIPGVDGKNVLTAEAAYDKVREGAELGENLVVLGGGLVGCETGLFLAERGHDVTIIEMQDEIAPEANWMHKEGMMQSFAKAPITARTGLRVSKVEPGRGVYARQRRGR